jgi:hypothetical protein
VFAAVRAIYAKARAQTTKLTHEAVVETLNEDVVIQAKSLF